MFDQLNQVDKKQFKKDWAEIKSANVSPLISIPEADEL